MRSRATFRGHGLHPVLVTLPLGALPTSLLFQALHLFTGNAAWYQAAFVAVLVVTVGIVAASVPGVMDLVSVVPREGEVWKRATSHMALGFALGGYYVGLAVLMGLALPAPPAGWIAWALFGLNAAGLVLMGVQGFWGGELVARHAVGVHHSALEEDVQSGRAPARRPGRDV